MSAQWTIAGAPSRLTLVESFAQRHPVWWRATLAYAALAAVFLAASLVDDRLFNGVSVWVKPFKFSLSIAVYFATLAWFAPLLPNGYFEARRGRWLTWLPVACSAFEIAYIALQAARGEASHFNLTSAFYIGMYALMGVGALVLVSMCLWMACVVLRRHGLRDPYALAVALGLIAAFVLGGGFGEAMAANMSHWVGGVPTDAGGFGPMRWSRTGGDLRVAHFFGMHAMQFLPVFAALLPRTLPRKVAIGLVVAAAVGYAGFATFTFVEALRGVPFI